VYFACPTIAIAKIRDYSQSTYEGMRTTFRMHMPSAFASTNKRLEVVNSILQVKLPLTCCPLGRRRHISCQIS